MVRTVVITKRLNTLLSHRCVSRPSFCSLILVGLTVLKEMFHCHGRCAAVAHQRFSREEFCQRMVPESWMFGLIGSIWFAGGGSSDWTVPGRSAGLRIQTEVMSLYPKTNKNCWHWTSERQNAQDVLLVPVIKEWALKLFFASSFSVACVLYWFVPISLNISRAQILTSKIQFSKNASTRNRPQLNAMIRQIGK